MSHILIRLVVFLIFYVTLVVGDTEDDAVNYDKNGSPPIGQACEVDGQSGTVQYETELSTDCPYYSIVNGGVFGRYKIYNNPLHSKTCCTTTHCGYPYSSSYCKNNYKGFGPLNGYAWDFKKIFFAGRFIENNDFGSRLCGLDDAQCWVLNTDKRDDAPTPATPGKQSMETNPTVALDNDVQEITPDAPDTLADNLSPGDSNADNTAGDAFAQENWVQGDSQDAVS